MKYLGTFRDGNVYDCSITDIFEVLVNEEYEKDSFFIVKDLKDIVINNGDIWGKALRRRDGRVYNLEELDDNEKRRFSKAIDDINRVEEKKNAERVPEEEHVPEMPIEEMDFGIYSKVVDDFFNSLKEA